ncbi:MAG: beta-N-acetylhexosaminidase [Bdellovibrionales bacterium]
MSLNNIKAVIYSCEGCVLSEEERSFFHEAQPLGFILFGRNCDNPEQLYALTSSLREAVGWDCPILIDQEGGRVQRLKPPLWRGFPAMQSFGEQAAGDMDAALDDLRYTVLQLSEELLSAGVNVNCAPVMDVLTPITHDVIGDRAFSYDPDIVARLGLSACRHFLAAGVVPIVKHIPGHGRANVDSHKDLPRVSASLQELRLFDFKPFQEIAASDIGAQVWAMAAHIVYESIDADLPSSASPRVINDIIRGDIGFDGLLVSDDLDMDALSLLGDVAQRSVAVLNAGCDVALYCSGKLEDMQSIAKVVPNLTEKARKSLQNSLKALQMTV